MAARGSVVASRSGNADDRVVTAPKGVGGGPRVAEARPDREADRGAGEEAAEVAPVVDVAHLRGRPSRVVSLYQSIIIIIILLTLILILIILDLIILVLIGSSASCHPHRRRRRRLPARGRRGR